MHCTPDCVRSSGHAPPCLDAYQLDLRVFQGHLARRTLWRMRAGIAEEKSVSLELAPDEIEAAMRAYEHLRASPNFGHAMAATFEDEMTKPIAEGGE